MYGAKEANLFLPLGSLERSSVGFSFIFSVRPSSRRNIVIKILWGKIDLRWREGGRGKARGNREA